MFIFLSIDNIQNRFIRGGVCQRIQRVLLFFHEGDLPFHVDTIQAEVTRNVEIIHDLLP